MKNKMNYREIIELSIFIMFIIFLQLLPNKSMRTDYKVDHSSYIENPHSIRDKADKSLIIGVDSLNMNLNPFYDKNKDVGLISRLLNPSLVYRKADGSWDLDLASEFWYENDGRTLVFRLKEVYFNDGRLLSADDVVTTYKVLADPKYEGIHVDYVEKIRGSYDYGRGTNPYDFGVVAHGSDLVKFHFNFYDKKNISYLDFPIVNTSQLGYKYNDLAQVKNFEATDGAGLFKLDGVGKDNSISLVKKDWEEAKEIDFDQIIFKSGLYFKIIEDYKKGQVDLVYKYNKNSDIMALLTDRTFTYTRPIENQQGTYSFLGFNMRDSIFSDRDMRRALANSLSLEKYNNIYYGKGNHYLAQTPVYRNSYLYNDQVKLVKEGSLSSLLEERYGSDRPKEIRMISSKNNDYIKTIGDYMVEDLAREGLILKIDYLQEADLFDRVYMEGDYDIFAYQRYMIESPNLANQFIFNINDELNISADPNWSIINQLERSSYFISDQERKSLVDSWQEYFTEDIPYLITNTPLEISLINNRIENIHINEFGGIENKEKLKNIKIVLN